MNPQTNHGLNFETVEQICEVLGKHPEVATAVLYGSRAKGTHKPGSDIDLCLSGKNLTLSLLLKIETQLDDLLLPYKIDLSLLDSIDNSSLIEHIKRVGVVFYKKP